VSKPLQLFLVGKDWEGGGSWPAQRKMGEKEHRVQNVQNRETKTESGHLLPASSSFG
jgi:hypothetical protein